MPATRLYLYYLLIAVAVATLGAVGQQLTAGAFPGLDPDLRPIIVAFVQTLVALGGAALPSLKRLTTEQATKALFLAHEADDAREAKAAQAFRDHWTGPSGPDGPGAV